MLCTAAHPLHAQAPSAPAASAPAVPDWAQPGSATHVQVPPPPDFHRPSKNFDMPIGVFEGQSDIGGAVVPGSASYDAGTKQYTINSAGYNIWYIARRVPLSLEEDVRRRFPRGRRHVPGPEGYGDRKAVLVIRQDLDDDSREAYVALHGAGMIHLAQRPEKSVRIKDMEYRVGAAAVPAASSRRLVTVNAKRIGIEKRGDSFALFVSLEGEPMHQFGPPIAFHLDEPFYVGIGFCSHLPTTSDTAVLSDVILANSAGEVE